METETLLELERGMWQQATRGDVEWTRRHLSADFVEFGASGRVYDRASVLALAIDELDGEVHDLVAQPLGAGRVQLRYRVELAGAWSNRSSIWERGADGQWRMVFHQGTPIG